MAAGVAAMTMVASDASAAEPLATVRPCASAPAPQPPFTGTPWPQQRFDLPRLHRLTDGSGVTVAVVDSGVDARARQLAGAVVPGADTLDPAGDGRQDCVGHGTAVASIIAGSEEAGAGLQGLAPGVRILPVRVSERIDNGAGIAGAGTVADLAAGIRMAIAAHPRPAVVNLSISTTVDDPALRSAVAAALAADIVVVAAVGNNHDGGDPIPYPAAYDGVVGVGAIGRDGLRAPSSQVGRYVDLTAPGSAAVGASSGHRQQIVEGTSFAAAFVAAAAALVRARFPTLPRADVVARLLATADPAPGAVPSPQYGYGIVNPVRALTEVVTRLRATAGPLPNPALGPGPSPRPSPGPDGVVIGAAVTLIAGAVLLGAVAAAMPAGRRRRWRPGVPAPGALSAPDPHAGMAGDRTVTAEDWQRSAEAFADLADATMMQAAWR